MEPSFWIDNWCQGKTGFHQQSVNTSLPRFWPALPPGSTVLVPLCGKSLDMLWLEQQGLAVTGVELAEQAAREFCQENGLAFSISRHGGFNSYRVHDKNIRLIVADFFSFAEAFSGKPFDSLYDRASLVALPPEMRKPYVQACRSLLSEQATGMILTLEYEQELMPGPPFRVSAAEVQRLWRSALSCVDSRDVLDDLPKARAAGVPKLEEFSWIF